MIKNFAYWKNESVPGITYQTFSATCVVNSAVITNGGASVSYSYTSVSDGGGIAVFENSGPVGLAGSTLQVTACLPNDSTNFVLIPNPVDGDGPRTGPTNTLVACIPP